MNEIIININYENSNPNAELHTCWTQKGPAYWGDASRKEEYRTQFKKSCGKSYNREFEGFICRDNFGNMISPNVHVQVFCLQTMFRWKQFSNSLDIPIFQLRQIFIVIWNIMLKLFLRKLLQGYLAVSRRIKPKQKSQLKIKMRQDYKEKINRKDSNKNSA